jgi:hypothetical protein
MAVRKLSLPLFAAKTRVSRTGESPQYLHFPASIRQDRNQYAFVCEAQPLLTLTNYGLPKRCSFCTQDDPIGTERQ